MRIHRVAFVSLCCSCALTLVACGSSSSKTTATTGTGTGTGTGTTAPHASTSAKTIAISFPNGSKQDAVLKEFNVAKAEAKADGFTLIIDDPGNDQQKQINTIDTWIQEGVGALIVQPVGAPETIETEAAKARKAGIKWITYANQITNQDATLGFDHIAGGNEIGKAACDYVNANLGGTAKAALLTYEPGAWAQKREQGITQGLASCGAKISVVAKHDALSQTDGVTAMSTILQANPDVNIVLAVEETATEGAYQAFVNAGKSASDPKLFLAGIDGTKHALQLIQQGSMYRASAALSLTSVGKGMVLLPQRLEAGTPGDYLVPLELVTKNTPDLLNKYLTDLS